MEQATGKIPKIIHYVWLGSKEKPEHIKKNMETWRQHLPDYELMEWNESNFDIQACPFTRESMELKKYAFVSDAIRVYALYEYGGIYLDTDVVVLKSFDPLLDYSGVLCYESKYWLSAGVMAAEKHSRWAKRCWDYYKNRPLLKRGKINATSNVMAISALTVDMYGFKLNGKEYPPTEDGFKIFTGDYFSPKNYMTGKYFITDNSYAIHDFAAQSSWWSPAERRGAAFAKFMRKILGARIFGLFEKMVMKGFVGQINREIKQMPPLDGV